MTKLQDCGKALHTVHFESPSHTGTLLCGLQALRCKGLLIDVTLVAEGEAFLAHKAVLASCSDYFRAMFTDAMKESRESEIKLNGVTAAGIRLLLDYAYTSRLALTLENIQDILSAASHVQVVAVVEACSSYLQAQIDLDNCIDIATLAEIYSLPQLRKRVYRFMCAHLSEFSRSPDFQRLSPAQLEHLLACDFPVDCSELQVLNIVTQWIKKGGEKCQNAALKILRRVHFNEIPERELEGALLSVQDSYYTRLILLEADFQRKLVQDHAECIPPLINSRGMELAVIKVGGFGLGGITNEVTYFLASSGKWRHLTSIPHVEQCNFGTAVLDNELYVVGGCFNQCLLENIHPFGFRYCPQANKWSTMAPMQRERCRFSLNVVGGRLYAVGGSNETEDDDAQENICLCECYDPATDSWETITPTTGNRSQHAGAAWPPNSPYFLFISGGLDRDLVLSSMHCYNCETDTWETKAPMLSPRADHVMLTIGDKVYVCGGWREDESTGGRVLVDTIDAYVVSENRWETVTTVPSPRYHAGIVSVHNKIYFIGGFHSDSLFDRATASVYCYDLETNVWSSKEKYPQDIWEHTCVTLYVPRCRDDMEVLPLAKRMNADIPNVFLSILELWNKTQCKCTLNCTLKQTNK